MHYAFLLLIISLHFTLHIDLTELHFCLCILNKLYVIVYKKRRAYYRLSACVFGLIKMYRHTNTMTYYHAYFEVREHCSYIKLHVLTFETVYLAHIKVMYLKIKLSVSLLEKSATNKSNSNWKHTWLGTDHGALWLLFIWYSHLLI